MNIALRTIRTLAVFAGLGVLAAALPAAAQDIGIETTAKQAYLMDADTDAVLLAKNSDQLMHPSSMSKLMTIYLVFEKLHKGELKLSDTFTVSEKAWRLDKQGEGKGGSTMFVQVGTKVSVGDLLQGVIVQSGNDACVVLAEGIAGSEQAFAEQMNKRARELGLTHSTFRNASGLPDPEHLMTAHDLAILARHLINDFPEDYKYFSEISFTYNGIKQGNRNPLLYKNMNVDGLKTGHTEGGGYGLTASAKRNGRRLILVLNGMSSMNERSHESERLLEWGFREFDNYALFKKGERIEDAEVWLGEEAKVALVPDHNIVLTLPRTARKDMKVAVLYTGPVPAPIQKGAPIARLVISAPNMQPLEIPLQAAADVPRLGPTGRVKAALSQLVWGTHGK